MAEEIFGFNRADTSAIIEAIGQGDSVQRLNMGGGDSVFGFKTTGAMTSGSAAGSIYQLSQTAFASPLLTGQTIIASILFGTLAIGTIGYCVKSGGVYYVIQASCPAEEEEV